MDKIDNNKQHKTRNQIYPLETELQLGVQNSGKNAGDRRLMEHDRLK